MKRIDDFFRDSEAVKKLVSLIKEYKGKPIKLMEVCGTHTMAISRFGIRSVLPQNITLISGPGCPVCVTPNYYVKAAIDLASQKDIIITTFGDMLRIPFRGTSLIDQKARGCDVRIVYSPLDSVEIAKDNPQKKVIFLSVGFETTVPVSALSVLEAERRGIGNYMILSANKTMNKVMHVLSSDRELNISGYIYPGHVSAIIGDSLYNEILEEHKIPGVITGFEPVDILGAVLKLCRMDTPAVENLYTRVVKSQGNPVALSKIYEVFESCDSVWRGLGLIADSGLKLKQKYSQFDAWALLDGEIEQMEDEPTGCRCGDILKGKCMPSQCKHFGKSCTPETPVGSCMVSSEGTCAAYYKYQQ